MAEAPEHESGGWAAIAAQLSEGGRKEDLIPYLERMAGTGAAADRAARVVEGVAQTTPALLSSHVPQLIRLLYADRPKVAGASAASLVALTRTAPAKVAKHLDVLRERFDEASAPARDGTIRVIVGLCRASVAYQRRVIDLLERALSEVDAPTLVQWAELMLPILKGEPYSQARQRVEERLPDLDRGPAKRLAAFLGVRLRHA